MSRKVIKFKKVWILNLYDLLCVDYLSSSRVSIYHIFQTTKFMAMSRSINFEGNLYAVSWSLCCILGHIAGWWMSGCLVQGHLHPRGLAR